MKNRYKEIRLEYVISKQSPKWTKLYQKGIKIMERIEIHHNYVIKGIDRKEKIEKQKYKVEDKFNHVNEKSEIN